ncbi:MgtC/SapB family protein [Treponema sp.]|uniref:MgtC/SapB family protein n=1 Tax=Treponema sp. TaxID=166 RepID=UPI0025DDC54F|nr:MgtC/SapB family protein [Treponema sp.]
MFFDWPYILECSIKIVLSSVFGFVLGIERKRRKQVIGTRTLILICVSSCLLAILSGYTATGEDSSRISAQVVSGVGFLGGGAIMRQGLNIKGLTSAGVIWTAAALGLSLGSGLYIQSALVLVVVVFLLVALEKVEGRMFPAARNKTIHLSFENQIPDLKKIKEILKKYKFGVRDIDLNKNLTTNITELLYSVIVPVDYDIVSLVEELNKIGDLLEFSISD